MAYPQGPWNWNRRILARTYASGGSQSIFSNTKPQGKSFYMYMATKLIAAPHLPLQTAVENNITIIRLSSHYTHTLQPSKKCFSRPLKICKSF